MFSLHLAMDLHPIQGVPAVVCEIIPVVVIINALVILGNANFMKNNKMRKLLLTTNNSIVF